MQVKQAKLLSKDIENRRHQEVNNLAQDLCAREHKTGFDLSSVIISILML